MSDWFERTVRRSPEPLPPDATRESLLAEVLAHPEQDEPRWVVSDWYRGQGDARGEFIAAQLTLATLDPADSGFDELNALSAALLKKHKPAWVGRFKGTRTEYGVEGEQTWAKSNPTFWEFERGFVRRVKMAAADFLVNAGELLVCEPVQAVQLTQARGEVSRFLEEGPALEQLRGLDLSRNKLTDDDLETLFSCRRLTSLQRLNLGDCGLGMRRGSRVFSACTATFPALRTLNLYGNGLGDKGVEALVRSGLLSNLGCLILVTNKIGDRGARALIDVADSTAITDLRVLGNGISTEASVRLEACFTDFAG